MACQIKCNTSFVFHSQHTLLTLNLTVLRVFAVENETDNYRLHVDGYNNHSTAGDSLLSSGNYLHDNMQFSTKDRDNDR